MRVYLDACCFNRPFDDQRQQRIRLEAEAVLLIMDRLGQGTWRWLGSTVLLAELAEHPNPDKRARVLALARHIQEVAPLTPVDEARAIMLENHGVHFVDALHLACAERLRADAFLTTDDRLLRRARRVADTLQLEVANPLGWLLEHA